MEIIICIFFIELLFFYKSGRLDLEDTFGTVTWRNRMNISDSIVLSSKKTEIDCLDKSMFLILKNYSNLTYRNLLYKIFPYGIKKEIEKFIENVKQKKVNGTRIQKEILVSKKWGQVMEEIGFPRNVKFDEDYINHISMLKKMRDEI